MNKNDERIRMAIYVLLLFILAGTSAILTMAVHM